MAHINSIKLKYKSYDKRKIVFSIDKKTYYVEPCWGWYSVSTSDIEVRTVVRDVVMNNLYWLLGRGCDIETWKESLISSLRKCSRPLPTRAMTHPLAE